MTRKISAFRQSTWGYTYDGEGNRLTRTRISTAAADDHLTEYTWDYRNRLTAVTFKNNAGTVTKRVVQQYDVFNRWVGQLVDSDGDADFDRSRQFVYDGYQIVLEFQDADGDGASGSSLTNRYLWSAAVDQLLADERVDATDGTPGDATDILWALADHLGTVRDIAQFDPAANSGAGETSVVNHRVFESFGKLLSETNANVSTLFGFTGRPFDIETKLQNNLHRWYEGPTARWLSEDPIQDDQANWYRYSSNMPITHSDPTGLKKYKGNDGVVFHINHTDKQSKIWDMIEENDGYGYGQPGHRVKGSHNLRPTYDDNGKKTGVDNVFSSSMTLSGARDVCNTITPEKGTPFEKAVDGKSGGMIIVKLEGKRKGSTYRVVGRVDASQNSSLPVPCWSATLRDSKGNLLGDTDFMKARVISVPIDVKIQIGDEGTATILVWSPHGALPQTAHAQINVTIHIQNVQLIHQPKSFWEKLFSNDYETIPATPFGPVVPKHPLNQSWGIQ